MTPTTAIQRAEQWRKEGACGEAAKVAIALLNELERVRNETLEEVAEELSKGYVHLTNVGAARMVLNMQNK
ncbi:hypothetical protein FEE59_13545 [Herbaspirillum sp. RU 5E]|nr:hypothetical protein [Herbaspirillum sp. RU 5E]